LKEFIVKYFFGSKRSLLAAPRSFLEQTHEKRFVGQNLIFLKRLRVQSHNVTWDANHKRLNSFLNEVL